VADLSVSGIDVLLREESAIPVAKYDGQSIPHLDDSFDTVLLVDVLHHTDEPMGLLREALRVARRSVLIKDHCRDGFLAGPTLRFMDWVGNSAYGVHLPYNYWSKSEWDLAFAQLGAEVEHWQARLRLYPFPASLLFDRSLHFIARLTSNPGNREV
jgi:SAM-dependent methyltransferase